MAKKAIRESKSAAIRAYKENNPAAGPTAIAEALSKEGMKVTPAFVSTVLSNARRKSRRGKRKAGRKPGRPASTGGERGLVIGAAAFATTRCVGAIVYIGASMYRELG